MLHIHSQRNLDESIPQCGCKRCERTMTRVVERGDDDTIREANQPRQCAALVPAERRPTPTVRKEIHVVLHHEPSRRITISHFRAKARKVCLRSTASPREHWCDPSDERPVEVDNVRLEPFERLADTRAPRGIAETRKRARSGELIMDNS